MCCHDTYAIASPMPIAHAGSARAPDSRPRACGVRSRDAALRKCREPCASGRSSYMLRDAVGVGLRRAVIRSLNARCGRRKGARRRRREHAIGQSGTAARMRPLVNGVLLHGLGLRRHASHRHHPSDRDVPPPPPSASREAQRASGCRHAGVLIAGMECAIRIGASVKGGFHHVGSHATGVISHFQLGAGCRTIARSRRRCAHARARHRRLDGRRRAGVPRGRRMDQATASRLGRGRRHTAATLAKNGFSARRAPTKAAFWPVRDAPVQEHAAE